MGASVNRNRSRRHKLRLRISKYVFFHMYFCRLKVKLSGAFRGSEFANDPSETDALIRHECFAGNY